MEQQYSKEGKCLSMVFFDFTFFLTYVLAVLVGGLVGPVIDQPIRNKLSRWLPISNLVKIDPRQFEMLLEKLERERELRA